MSWHCVVCLLFSSVVVHKAMSSTTDDDVDIVYMGPSLGSSGPQCGPLSPISFFILNFFNIVYKINFPCKTK